MNTKLQSLFDAAPTTCGHSALQGVNMCTYESIRQAFDYHHGDANGNDLGYCVEYRVRYFAPSWSTGKWFDIEGVMSNGVLVDLLFIGYDFQYKWLVAGTYRPQ